MRRNIITLLVCLAVCVLGVGIYLFFHYESNENNNVGQADQVDMSKVYSIPNLDAQTSSPQNITIERSSASSTETISTDGPIDKKFKSVKEVKTSIVKKSFITTSKDIATF